MLLKINFLSQTLRMQTNVTVVLPSFTFADVVNREEESYVPGTKFQTLYLLHGGYGDDSDYVNFTNIVRYADDHKVAVVMPNGYNSWYEDDTSGPLTGRYWQFISEELPRVCETMFPLSTRPEDTFAAGLSMGAFGAMNLAIRQGERFNTVLLMSGAVWDSADRADFTTAAGAIDAEALRTQSAGSVHADLDIYRQAAENIREDRPHPELIMTCGTEDFVIEPVRDARDLLRGIGYGVRYEEVPGYTHEWDFWDMSLRKAFEEWLPLRHDVIRPR